MPDAKTKFPIIRDQLHKNLLSFDFLVAHPQCGVHGLERVAGRDGGGGNLSQRLFDLFQAGQIAGLGQQEHLQLAHVLEVLHQQHHAVPALLLHIVAYTEQGIKEKRTTLQAWLGFKAGGHVGDGAADGLQIFAKGRIELVQQRLRRTHPVF